jgi:hypothetical protein
MAAARARCGSWAKVRNALSCSSPTDRKSDGSGPFDDHETSWLDCGSLMVRNKQATKEYCYDVEMLQVDDTTTKTSKRHETTDNEGVRGGPQMAHHAH